MSWRGSDRKVVRSEAREKSRKMQVPVLRYRGDNVQKKVEVVINEKLTNKVT